MKIRAVVAGTTFYKKHRDFALFGFQPAGKQVKTIFRVYFDETWSVYDAEPEWAPVGVAWMDAPGEGVIIVASSAEGQLWQLNTFSGEEQQLQIPGDYSEMTGLASIDGAIWACGMGRVVLRRGPDGSWTDLSAPDPSVDEGVIGFTALAGSPTGEIVAVGWRGEIWLRRRNRWEAQDTGTTTNLNAVSIGADGRIVAVGDDGLVVVGRRNQWSVLEIDADFNLQGVCHLGKQVFVCSDFELFRLEGEELVPETRFADGKEPETCMNLLANEKTIFSQGEKDIFRFANGVWTRIS